MSGIRKSGLENMDSDELSRLLYRHGVSHTGINSIRENGITGEMFHDFCEEDIKDAFSVFKDRFTVRKLLREFKAPSSASGKQPSETLTQLPSSHLQSPQQIHRSQDRSPTQALPSHISLPRSGNSLKRTWSSMDVKTETHHGSNSPIDSITNTSLGQPIQGSSREPQSPRQYESNPLHVVQMYRNVPSVDGSKFHKPNTELMYQTVSSSNEALSPARKAHNDSDAVSHHRHEMLTYRSIKSETSAAVDFANNQLTTFVENLSNRRNSQPVSRESPPLVISEVRSEATDGQVQWHEEQQTRISNLRNVSTDSVEDVQSPDNSFEEEKHDFMMNLVTSTISQFSPEQLLEKKCVRGRPSEAQRLGTVLIRNAAQSTKIWNSAPLLKDIPHDQKESFMKYVLTSAPQLSSHSELVWTRLREALQNRRKYLLDKESGKRVLKGRSHFTCVDGFVDLTDNIGGIDVSHIKHESV